MHGFKEALLLICCSWLTGGAEAQEAPRERGREPPAPDLDFLEYLGTWAEGDDEWLALEEWRKNLSADAKDAGRAEDAKSGEGAKESESERDDDHESE